jgi:predicted permease
VAEPEQVDGVRVTAGALELLGARPVQGRLFSAEDDAPGAPLTTILGYGYWQQRFGGAPDVVGRTIQLDGRSHEIIGVLPQGFRFIEENAAVMVTFQLDPTQLFLGNFSYFGLARLKPGATIAQANADVSRMIRIATERYAAPDGLSAGMLEEARFGPNVRPLEREVIGDVGNVLWVLLGTVAIVLVIACANVANLFLVRAEGRYREVAVRSALGAGRRQLALDFLSESVTLAAVSGMIAIGLAFAGVRLLQAMAPQGLPRLEQIGIDGSVLLVAAAITLLAGLFLGLIPVARHTRLQLAGALREGGRGGSAGRERHRARSALVAAQLALALVLLAGSGLMLRSVMALRSVDPGFERPRELLTLRLSIPSAEVAEPEAVLTMHERILRSFEAAARRRVRRAWCRLADHERQRQQRPDLHGRLSRAGEHAAADTPLQVDRARLLRQHGHAATRRPRPHVGRCATASQRARDQREPGEGILGLGGSGDRAARDQRAGLAVARDRRRRRRRARRRRRSARAGHRALAHDVRFAVGARTCRRSASMSYALRLDRPLTPALMDQVRQAVWAVNANLPLAQVRTMDEILARSMAPRPSSHCCSG